MNLGELLYQIGYTVNEASKAKLTSLLDKTRAELEAHEQGTGKAQLSARQTLNAALTSVQQKAADERAAQTEALGKRERDTVAKSGKAIADDAKKAVAKREKDAKDEAKRNRERRTEETKELRAFATEIKSVMGTVTAAIGGTAGLVSIGGFLSGIKSSAADFSRLQTESKRTGSSPQNIKAFEYAMEQMGVDPSEAHGSLDSFSSMYKDNPAGYASLLAGMGVRSKEPNGKDRDLGSVLEDMGKWFGTVSDPVARMQAGRFGIGPNAMIAMRQYAEMMKQVDEYNKKAGTFGLDVNKASEDGKKFTAAYNNMTTDMGMIRDKLEAEFFGPLTTAMNKLSKLMEENPETVKLFAEGFVALSLALSARVIPGSLAAHRPHEPAGRHRAARLAAPLSRRGRRRGGRHGADRRQCRRAPDRA